MGGTDMKKYITLIVASLMALTSMSQRISVDDEREFYGKALQLLKDYAKCASVSDDEKEYRFGDLFDKRMHICNDLMSLSHEDTLSVDEYVEILRAAKNVTVVVKDIEKVGPVKKNGNAWVFPIVFKKGISYSKDGIWFDSHDWFGQYYPLRAELSFDEVTRECRISKLEADFAKGWLSFDKESCWVLQRADTLDMDDNLNHKLNVRNRKRDNKLTVNGKSIRWNLLSQVLLKKDDVVRYNGSEVELKELSNIDGIRIYRANYNDKSFRVRANMGYSLSDFNQLTDANSLISISENKEMSFGVDFGFVFPTTSKFYFGVFSGLNMSSNNFTMNLGSTVGSEITDIKECTADEDGDTYTRHYVLKGTGVSQQLKATNLTIPVYGDLEYQLTPLLSAYADLGVLIRMSSGTWSAHIDGYETSGIYSQSQYGGVEIKGDVNLNGFGSWGPRDMDVDDEGMAKSMAIHALAGLGLRLNLNNSFALDAGVQYLTGGKSWKMNSDKKYIFDYTRPLDATTAKDKAQGDRVNLLRQSSGIKSGAFRVTASLIYKF